VWIVEPAWLEHVSAVLQMIDIYAKIRSGEIAVLPFCHVKRPYWWLNLAAGSEKKDVIWKTMFGSGIDAAYFWKRQMMAKFIFRKTVLYSRYFNFCIYVCRISFFKLTYVHAKIEITLNTKPFFEKQILPSFAAPLIVVFQITSSSSTDLVISSMAGTYNNFIGQLELWTNR